MLRADICQLREGAAVRSPPRRTIAGAGPGARSISLTSLTARDVPARLLPSGVCIYPVDRAGESITHKMEVTHPAHFPITGPRPSPCMALQHAGRRLARFIRRGQRERDAERKRAYIEKYTSVVGIALQEILDLSEQEEKRIVDTLTDTLERSRRIE